MIKHATAPLGRKPY